ncbi:hypothetical protein R9C00_18680 [Flammeovirgaceae bacterium SG7u.111]|nr:hypothetical protein [Flammeovirgaceae bacterium SG7u.132]WPO33728.1 hypothetical protein R9C00_18680 [Flammeovirgaceae bacterium SG7u.111]
MKWSAIRNILQTKFDELNDADLHYEEGKEDELVQRLSHRLNKSEEEVIQLVDEVQTKII